MNNTGNKGIKNHRHSCHHQPQTRGRFSLEQGFDGYVGPHPPLAAVSSYYYLAMSTVMAIMELSIITHYTRCNTIDSWSIRCF